MIMAGNAYFVNLQDIQSSFLFKAMNMRYENVFLEKAVLMTEKNCLLKTCLESYKTVVVNYPPSIFPYFKTVLRFSFGNPMLAQKPGSFLSVNNSSEGAVKKKICAH